jgi:hypothetical protein
MDDLLKREVLVLPGETVIYRGSNCTSGESTEANMPAMRAEEFLAAGSLVMFTPGA